MYDVMLDYEHADLVGLINRVYGEFRLDDTIPYHSWVSCQESPNVTRRKKIIGKERVPMLSWLDLAIERWTRASSSRQNRLSNHVPLWNIRRLSNAKLVRTLRYVYRNSAAQRKYWNN